MYSMQRWIKWLYPGMNIKRWFFLFSTGVTLCAAGIALFFRYKFIHIVETFLEQLTYMHGMPFADHRSMLFGFAIFVLGIFFMVVATRKSIQSVLHSVAPDNATHLLDKIFSRKKLDRGPAITVIGGGTGLSVLLRGIKELTNNCTAVVTCADDGGSSGRLREAFGIIPPGDCRNCLIAMADTEPLMEKLMQYRFDGNSELAGHNFGNLFITAMSDIVGNMESALNTTSQILKVRGRVIPSTLQPAELIATLSDGRVVRGESSISSAGGKIKEICVAEPDMKATASAIEAIGSADVIILGPGSLFTSVIANVLIKDIKEALLQSKAVKIYICNVMTQAGETDGFTAFDHVRTLLSYMDDEQFLDYVIVNNQFDVQPALLEKYAQENAYQVVNDSERLQELGIKVVPTNLLSQDNLIRHNPRRLARTLIRLIYDLKDSNNIFEYYFIKNIMRKFKEEK